MATRGGSRRGAGRKPRIMKVIEKGVAIEILSPEFEKKQWLRFLNSDDERIALDAFKYLKDRLEGKPPQAVDLKHKGEVKTRLIIDVARPAR